MSSSKGNSKYSSKKSKNPTKAGTSLVLTLRGNFLAIHFHPVLFFSLACFYRYTSHGSHSLPPPNLCQYISYSISLGISLP